MRGLSSLVFILLIIYSAATDLRSPPCDSEIYCHGPLLDTIQRKSLYRDSKTFVDMKLVHPPNVTIRLFREMMDKFDDNPSKSDLRDFINTNFEKEGSEFEEWIPSDWTPNPKFLKTVRDPNFRKWASDLNSLWKFLGRKMKKDVELNRELYSIIWIPHPVIVPGGRFREFYYWDSYWIIQGLLLSEMYQTVKGMLSNFMYIVEDYGLIPNGGRIYYKERSQMPLLIPMVKSYLDITKNFAFVEEHIHTMEKEFDYWMTKHTVTVEVNNVNYTLARYGDYSKGPRPESYIEDIESARIFRGEEAKEAYYSELKAAAESGWDFSSRWFISNATNKGNLTNLAVRSIIPVDLNAVIYWDAVLLAEFWEKLGNNSKKNYYLDIAKKWKTAVNNVLWHEDIGAWLDYDMKNNVKRDYFYPSNISPLWTGCYDREKSNDIIPRVLKYLQNMNVMIYQGGVPTTLEHTGEQWDFPNAWPPLQHIMIMGLHQTGDDSAKRLAYEMTENWVRANYKGFNETEAMLEKYDAVNPGGYGGGGEYDIQLGFGWTNGVIMDLLDKFGDMLSLEEFESTTLPTSTKEQSPNGAGPPEDTGKGTLGIFSTAIIAISVAAGLIGFSIYKKRSLPQVDILKSNRVPSRSQYTELRSMPRRSKSNK